jgi:hypothetical protein
MSPQVIVLTAVVEGTQHSPRLIEVGAYPVDKSDLPRALHEVAATFESLVKGLNPDCVVIRRADFIAKASRNDARSERLLIEGAITAGIRGAVVHTILATGKDVGSRCGTDKATAEAAAKAFMKAEGQPLRYAEAASAALSGLS